MLFSVTAGSALAKTTWADYIHHGTKAYDQGHYVDAEKSLSAALRQAAKSGTPDMLATSFSDLALIYTAQGKYAKAEPLYKHSLQIREKLFGANHAHVGASLNDLALLYDAQGKYAAAEPLYKRSLKISENDSGPDSPDTAQVLTNLAGHYREQEKYADAEPLYKRVLQICNKRPTNPKSNQSETCATCMEDYAMLLRKTNRKAEADKLIIRAKAIRTTPKRHLKEL